MNSMKTAPRDGTEILAWSNAGNWHPVVWKSSDRWPFHKADYWGMRWNTEYRQRDNDFEGWIPMPPKSV